MTRQAAIPALMLTPACMAAEPGGPYTLFNPVPRADMREMSTDRPDITESAHTVDAGHFQLEMSFVEWHFSDASDSDPHSRGFTIAPFLAKLGLLENLDLQVGLEPYIWLREQDGPITTTSQGLGDTFIRVKLNLVGNDDEQPGSFALAVMPAIKIPTANPAIGNGQTEFALIVPFGLVLEDGWDICAMVEADLVYPDADEPSVDFVHTATLGKDFTDEIGGFVEYAGVANFSHAEDYRASLNLGLWWQVTPDLKYDAGVRVGLTSATDDLQLFAGFAVRF